MFARVSVRARLVAAALLLAAAALSSAACRSGGAAPEPVSPAMPAGQAASVRGTVEQWRQAYEVRSVEALAKLYARDQAVIIQQGTESRGWAAIEPVLTSRLGNATQVRVRLKDVTVLPLGDAGATVIAGMTREISSGATTITEEGLLTLSLRNDAASAAGTTSTTTSSSWIIVSEHYSYRVK